MKIANFNSYKKFKICLFDLRKQELKNVPEWIS